MQRTWGQQTPARMRRAIVTSLRQTTNRLGTAQYVAAVDDMSSSLQSSLSRLPVLGHPKKQRLNTASPARNFACEAAKYLRVVRQSPPCEVQPLLKSTAKDAKELPGWIPGERMKTMHAVVPFGDNDTETSQTLQRLLIGAWTRPHMRPRWLKVDLHRSQISDEFMNWCDEVVDSAGKATEQHGKVEHNARLSELVLEDILAEVQPQTEYEWRGQERSVPEAS